MNQSTQYDVGEIEHGNRAGLIVECSDFGFGNHLHRCVQFGDVGNSMLHNGCIAENKRAAFVVYLVAGKGFHDYFRANACRIAHGDCEKRMRLCIHMFSNSFYGLRITFREPV